MATSINNTPNIKFSEILQAFSRVDDKNKHSIQLEKNQLIIHGSQVFRGGSADRKTRQDEGKAAIQKSIDNQYPEFRDWVPEL
jgi:hypothetical protein